MNMQLNYKFKKEILALAIKLETLWNSETKKVKKIVSLYYTVFIILHVTLPTEFCEEIRLPNAKIQMFIIC